MSTNTVSLLSKILRPLLAATIIGCAVPATAGMSFQLEQPSAAPGDSIAIQAVLFNDSTTATNRRPPTTLVVQWRGADGSIIRSIATLTSSPASLNVPVNNFARMSWQTVVPTEARGIQALSIEGEPALMALEVRDQASNTLVSLPAQVPVQDPQTGKPLPVAIVKAAGAQPDIGPSPEESIRPPTENATAGFNAFRGALSAYEPIYFSFGTRDGTTARFQISAKYRLFSPAGGQAPSFGENFYLGYTQKSLWDLESESMPFVDTTFNPSLFWLNESLWNSTDQHWRFGLNTGVEHRSNGKDGDESRSLNDFYIQPSINYRLNSGSTLTFAPRIKAYFGVEDENRDYTDYAGYVDWNLRWAQDNGAVVSAMYRQGASKHRSTQLDIAWPLKKVGLNMNGYLHLQYFNGYGETLLDYNQRNESQFRIGLSLVP